MEMKTYLAIWAMPPCYSPAAVLLGWETDFLISVAGTDPTLVGNIYGTKGGRIEFAVDEHECGDTMNGLYKAQKQGRVQLLVTANFYEKHNLTTVPTFISLSEIALAIYPNGKLGVTGETIKQPWIIPSFIFGPVTYEWDQDGKMSGTFSGKSNGLFYVPGN